MNLTEQIRRKISSLTKGETFGYSELEIEKNNYQTAAKVLERLQKQGVIKKLSKGIFYKPKQTVFGELKPDYRKQLQQYLFKNGKRVAYETGLSLYNRLGLTTQVPFRIKIASKGNRIIINRKSLKSDPVKSYVDVTDRNYQLLGFLDALKDIKKIPDSNISNSIKILKTKIKALDESKRDDLIKYALYYPPRVRALLGALLESLGFEINIEKLEQSLNPLTKYAFGIKQTDLPTITNWNIK